MVDVNPKKYKQLENILQAINASHICLPDDEKKRNTVILEQITETLIKIMLQEDPLFNGMYQKKFHGGSYYDGLKVGRPEEYDLDLILNLPSEANPSVAISDKHGFIHVLINDYSNVLKSNRSNRFKNLDTLVEDSKFLSTHKVLSWMEKVITRALNKFKRKDTQSHVFLVKINECVEEITATVSKAFPAFTLKLKGNNINLDLDLVPCFEFTDAQWPKGRHYRTNPSPSKDKFLVVPKQPHNFDGGDIQRYWRLSFQEQERALIKGNEYNSMKAVIKLLKKMRDFQNHRKIASYYIKTIFLWELENNENNFWIQPLSVVFIKMLIKYEEYLRKKEIPYYWNKNYNLIGHVKDATILDTANFLKNLLNNIQKTLDKKPFTVAYSMLTPAEVEILRTEVARRGSFKKMPLFEPYFPVACHGHKQRINQQKRENQEKFTMSSNS